MIGKLLVLHCTNGKTNNRSLWLRFYRNTLRSVSQGKFQQPLGSSNELASKSCDVAIVENGNEPFITTGEIAEPDIVVCTNVRGRNGNEPK